MGRNEQPPPRTGAERRADEDNKELAAAYNTLRVGSTLAARKDAVLTILLIDWGAEILAREPEFQARREAAREEASRKAAEARLQQEQRDRAAAEHDAERQREHERKMRDDYAYAARWRRENPRR